MRNKRGSTPWCTSGWTVQDYANSLWGTTAGHCENDIDRITHPGVWDHWWTYDDEYNGTWGDVQIHDSDAPLTPEFYAMVNQVREVTSLEPAAGFTLGEGICMFSRRREVQDCADVTDTSTCNGSWCNLVELDEDVAWGGDSGTVWYLGFNAYGIHQGSSCADDCNDPDGTSLLTVADRFDEALGVVVLLAE